MPSPIWIARLGITDFRNHAERVVEAGPGPVVITGRNGAGKTNLLEAVSMLAPGRGLRGAPLSEMARDGGPGGWAVAARLEGDAPAELGTGTLAKSPERRLARIDQTTSAIAALGERLSLSWATPAMDRLLAESPSARRRFLDRLVLALDPAHGRHATRYEAAMRERTRLLTADRPGDPRWLTHLETAMGAHGAALAAARARLVAALAPHLAATAAPFPQAAVALDCAALEADALAAELTARRAIDTAAGRATLGPHRADILVTDVASGQQAARCSTGEQKALLLGLMIAHADLVAEERGARPILLFDEIAAHLDTERRGALFERLPELGQVWLTGTDAATFAEVRGATRLELGAA